MTARNIALYLLFVPAAVLAGEPLTLDQTIERLLTQTTKGQIVNGQREVSQARFNAQKIGYYLPEISLNTTLPAYRQSQDYDTYFGFPDPLLFKRTNVSGDGNIRLRQKIITGGELTLETQLSLRNDEYPSAIFGEDTREIAGFQTATDKRRLGNLYIQFNQPLFQTSPSRSAYFISRDDLRKAEIDCRVSRADLKREGITAFFDLLAAEVDRETAQNAGDLAAFTARWDSAKFTDSVITEETWIMSKSKRLEKQLAMFDASAAYEAKANDFNHLLNLPPESQVMLQVSPAPPPPDPQRSSRLLANADKSAETQLAAIKLAMAERELDKVRSSYGLNGTLSASYAIGRGTVTQSKPLAEVEDKIKTKDWRVSLDLSYPIWDGGAGGASVHSQELAYESTRLEYQAAQRNAQNKMTILLKRLEITYAKLSLLQQELTLAEKKLRDAEGRYQQGFLSDGALLENRIYYLDAKKKSLTTLKEYLLDLTDLEKTELPE